MKIIKSQIVPIPRNDIDTDLIIPADFLQTTKKQGLGKHLFERLRKMEKDFPLNQKKYQDAQILVTNKNFGCGSSREHAAWAIYQWGIKVIIAESFSDIFYNNAFKNGILPIILKNSQIEKIISLEQTQKSYIITINLPEQKVILPDSSEFKFEIDPYRKECLIKNMNDLDYLLSNLKQIDSFKSQQKNKTLFLDFNLL